MIPRPIELLSPLLGSPPHLTVVEDPAAWEMIREHAGRYGVGGLVAYAARGRVPARGAEAWCDRVLVDNWRRHASMSRHLEEILAILRRERIPTIALKGPLLARRYYAPEFLRKPCLDLDLAVAMPNVPRACELLAREGYRADASLSEVMARSHHITLRHTARPTVEIHFRLSHMALGIPVDEFFARAIPNCRLTDGEEALVLGPADPITAPGSAFGAITVRYAFSPG